MLLLPEIVAQQDGSGPEVNLDQSSMSLLLNLEITQIIEDECLEVSLWGSSDARSWRHIAAFPQKFYCGDYSMELDLSKHPDVRHLRAHWKMGCWARGERKPLFGFRLDAEQMRVQHASV